MQRNYVSVTRGKEKMPVNPRVPNTTTATEMTWDAFHQRVVSDAPWRAVVVFEAAWCPACKRMRAPLDAFARRMSNGANARTNIAVVRVDADLAFESIQRARNGDRQRFAGSFASAIDAYPTIVFVDTSAEDPRLSRLNTLPTTGENFLAYAKTFFGQAFGSPVKNP